MAVTLTATLSDQYANSYVDVDYADAYWASHYNAIKAGQWSGLTADQKSRLLIEACRVIETARFVDKLCGPMGENFRWYFDRHIQRVLQLRDDSVPYKAEYFQSLQFPRTVDRDIQTGSYYIPEPIKNAQCEQAVYLLTFDDSAMVSRLQGVKSESVTVGTVGTSTTYSDGTIGNKWSPTALEYARPFMMKRSQQIRRA